MKRLIGLITVCLVSLASVAAAHAAGAQTVTVVVHQGEVTFVGTGAFCEFTPPVLINNTFNQVFHLTLLDNGTFHLTENTAGTTTSTEIVGGVTFSGHFTRHVGQNQNRQNETSQVTTNIVAEATEGPMQNAHQVEHANTTASGNENAFIELNCGGTVIRLA